MLDTQQRVLYVGKAINLSKRLLSHSRDDGHSPQLSWFLNHVASVDFLVVETEAEALFLEADFIKNDHPVANVLMKDDKSYPFLSITDESIPRMMLFRPSKNSLPIKQVSTKPSITGGRIFGPFSSTTEVESMIRTLQATFLLRVCPDSIYHGRKRPCLLYQIKRCSAPCTGEISEQDYALVVKKAFLTLQKHAYQRELLKILFQKAQKASQSQHYELAETYHARVRSLKKILIPQRIYVKSFKNGEIFAIARKRGSVCIQWFSFRDHRPSHHQRFFLKESKIKEPIEILEAFLHTFLHKKHASPVLVNFPVSSTLQATVSTRRQKRIIITHPLRGRKKALVNLAEINAQILLDQEHA